MKIIISLLLLGGLLVTGCKKENIISPANQTTFLDSTVQFLTSNLSQEDFAKLDTAKYEILVYKNRNIGIQIFEKNASADKFLLLHLESRKYSGNWIDMSNMNNTISKYRSGEIFLNSIDKRTTTKLIVDSNSVIQIVNTNNKTMTSVLINLNHKKISSKDNFSSLEYVDPVLPEVFIYYDGNGSSFDYSSLYWLFGGNSFYQDVYYGNSGSYQTTGGGGGGNRGGNVAAAPTFVSPDKPIVDIKKELGCFTKNSSATYEISINVNQPDPNTRVIFDPLSTHTVGHTFLTLQQHNADGSSVIRSVGFYPKTAAKPGSEIDQSVYGDDTETPYDVSLNFVVTGAELNTVVNTLINQQAYNYDLNNFNCTNAAMEALKSININLPSTKASETLFDGNDPGDLGEDIRNLNLDNFSAANGNHKIARTVSSSNNQQAPAKKGSC